MFKALIDYKFDSFITVKLSSVFYAILMVLVALFAGITVLSGIVALGGGDVGAGLLTIIFGPIFALILLVIIRLWFEQAIALILIAENTKK